MSMRSRKFRFGRWGVFAASVFAIVTWMALTGTAHAEAVQGLNIYPLDTCPVTGEKLGSMGKVIVKEIGGREVRFCCAGCPPTFEKDKAKYFAKVDAAIVKQQMPYYPLDTCVVTGEKLDAKGAATDYVYKNRLVRFSSKNSVGILEKDPAKYLAVLDKAVLDKQMASYPLDTCIVLGKKLGEKGETHDFIFGNRLVRFCCKGCVETFKKDPAPYMAKLDKGAK